MTITLACWQVLLVGVVFGAAIGALALALWWMRDPF
jgi:hypothetical protein